MADALTVARKFWEIQDSRDYTALVDLFADDAVLEDPIYGRLEGRDAIASFMATMNVETQKHGIWFDLVDLAGAGDVAWAQWIAHTPAGERAGVGIYRVENGKMTYYRDYMNAPVSTMEA